MGETFHTLALGVNVEVAGDRNGAHDPHARLCEKAGVSPVV